MPYVTCPTLVLRGAESVVSSPDGVADLGAALPACEVREIAGGSHLLLLEYPEAVAAAVRDFLRRWIAPIGRRQKEAGHERAVDV